MAHYRPQAIVQIHLVIVFCSLLPSPLSAFTTNHTVSAPSVQCLPDQVSALIRLKRSFVTTDYSVIAFRSWRVGTDCCHWEGIRCDQEDGRVTSLDLGYCGLESSRLDPVVFELTSLRYLNLAGNYFNNSKLPSSGFERLTKLTHLNLSTAHFGDGEVPHTIGRLTNLVSLDLSTRCGIDYTPGIGFHYWADSSHGWDLTLSNVTALVTNLGSLRELHLGFVDLSQSIDWCDALAKYTPNLHVLSLPFCLVPGPICKSLSTLHSLSVIDLQFNHLTGPLPDFLANFSFLKVLKLSYNSLEGWVSPSIFQNNNLVTIDLQNIYGISGNLPNFSSNSRLQNLFVGRTNFSGTIPSSIGNLKSLKQLGLDALGFSGILPSSIGTLNSLNVLKVSGLDVVEQIPSWITNLTSLELLQFSDCGLHGPIPSYIGGLSNLQILSLYKCKFSGNITHQISNFTQLNTLILNSNNFTGTIELNSLWKLPNLSILSLSNNKLLVVNGEHNSSVASYPNIVHLNLASCNINNFPSILMHLEQIQGLDLSNNQIHGAIPQWVWESLSNFELSVLNFSRNELTDIGYDTFLPICVNKLDLSFNKFQGKIPLPQYSGFGFEFDYSGNMFSSMPPNVSSQLQGLSVFKASRNNFSGKLPPSFCPCGIEILDLSYNSFNGSILPCLMEDGNALEVLNLRGNQLHGELPRHISENCTLEVLDLSGNRIEGQLPRSLAYCKKLEALDIGNNEISDSFPCWMSTLPRLQVLIIKYNRFFGPVDPSITNDRITCAFPSVRILDISSNNFSGTLTEEWITKLMSMMVNNNNETLVMEYKGFQGEQYQLTTELTYKGSEQTIEKILRTLAFLDVSNNAFYGRIPATIGELVLLKVLNMSHNSFAGPIPSQLGHLTWLEALDLSSNELSGEIPQEIASLDFLGTLNLSNNKLVGSIPGSPQLSTFGNSSFLGNVGLCGPPLSKMCVNTTLPCVVSCHSKRKLVDIILFLFVGLGFGVGFAIAIVVTWGIPIRKWY